MKKIIKNIFNVKGIVLDNEQLAQYMEKLAINYSVESKSSIDTYPIPELKNDFYFIEKTYNLLTEHLKQGIDIYPAGEWLLDNFYVIEESVKRVSKDLSLKTYRSLPGIAEGSHKGLARIYLIAEEIVSYRDCKIDDDTLNLAISAYKKRRNLSMEEIWNLNIFLQIALIQNIRNICEKIYSAELQKYKVENIVERLVEKKDTQNQRFNKESTKNEILYKELKFPFIEYMSFKLKKYGKRGIQYLNILEEQVNKLGLTVSEVIKKEHYDIAIKKVLIGNSITSIREISRINFLQLFEEVNGVEDFLKEDPANVYKKMDYKTKEYYRNKIKELAKKNHISENYIAKTVLNLAKNKEGKKSHVGYYLIDDGFKELAKKLNIKQSRKDVETKVNNYISSIFITTLIGSFLIGVYFYYFSKSILLSLLVTILAYIPISEITVQIINYILVKTVKPTLIPKLDLEGGIPEEYSTMVIIPTILDSEKKVKELVCKMEVYFLANKSENLYFTLLGDCTSSSNQNEEFDNKIIETGSKEIEKLNKKYNKEIFNFVYRNRTWNSSEKCYLGWERKRGLITEFNDFLVNGVNKFKANTINEKLNIKYIITLDSDTNLVLNSAFELIGAMAHILNTPVINERRNIVVEGHSLIQPRVGIYLDASRKSLFTKIYAGVGGIDSYTNAVSDLYQDSFNEGIFTGKGIYDLQVFHKILKDEIPENTVLSHDLLEGSYLRCGLATDILLMDGYPAKFSSYISRLCRWVRGDWQLLGWLSSVIKIKNGTKKTNPLNKLSKYKILDNLRRSLVPIIAFIFFAISIILKLLNYNTYGLMIVSAISILIPTVLDIINLIVFKKNLDSNSITAHKNIIKVINPIKASLLRSMIEVSVWPYKAYKLCDAISRTIYRIKVSKQNLLEWMTSDEAERQSKTDLKSYYLEMWINTLIAILVFISGVILKNLIIVLLSILFFVGPYLTYYISKDNKEKKKIEELNESDIKYLIEIGKRTWQFFKDNINSKNNFLPPDNFQEDRKEKIACRTSPTNIGLGILAVVSAYDLRYIDLNNAIEIIEKMLNTISGLEKWNGHLYNWYNTKTLEPLYPKYISTVDSGNFIGYLYTLKSFLIENTERQDLVQTIDSIIANTDFKVLYDYKKRLFSIGFNIEENKKTDSYYDLLASEARQASLIAIAKKDIPAKHWNSLSRTLTTLNRFKGLISWSGTAFEYLMPNINIKKYQGSLLDESCRFMIMSQKEYAKKLRYTLGYFRSGF